MSEPQTARLLLEVVAGVIPQRPEPELTRQWAITSAQWRAAEDSEEHGTGAAILLAEANGKAQGYAAWLMMQPDRVNWVRTDWIWL
jgi:hypothetical protein